MFTFKDSVAFKAGFSLNLDTHQYLFGDYFNSNNFISNLSNILNINTKINSCNNFAISLKR